MTALFNRFKAEYYFHIASKHIGERKYDLALPLLLKAKDMDAQHAGIFLQLGQVRLNAGDYDGALQDFAAAENLNSRNHSPSLSMGILHLQEKDIDKAEECFTRSLSLSPDNQLVKNYLSLCTIMKGGVEEGTESLRKTGIYSNQRFAGFLMTAVEDMLMARHPGHPCPDPQSEALERLPESAGHTIGNPPPAVDEKEESAEAVRDTAMTADRGITESAADTRDNAFVRLTAYPVLSVFYWFLAQHYLSREKFPKASWALRKVLHFAPRTQRVHFHLGESLFYQEMFSEALGHFQKSREEDGDNPEVLYYLGIIHQKEGKFTEAEALLSQSLARFTKSPEALYALGQIALHGGDSEKGRRYFTEAAEYDFTYILERLEETSKKLKCPAEG